MKGHLWHKPDRNLTSIFIQRATVCKVSAITLLSPHLEISTSMPLPSGAFLPPLLKKPAFLSHLKSPSPLVRKLSMSKKPEGSRTGTQFFFLSNGNLFKVISHRKEWRADTLQTHSAESKEPVPKDHTLSDSAHIKYPQRGKSTQTEPRLVTTRNREEGRMGSVASPVEGFLLGRWRCFGARRSWWLAQYCELTQCH